MNYEEVVAAGVQVAPDAFARLERYVALLLDESRRVNLTACRSADELWAAHVCDCLALLPHLPAEGGRLLDLGAGGGLPGIALACARPALLVTLLDATRKKIDALGRIIAALGLPNATARWGRAEVLAHEPAERERYDVVTARAVAALPELIEYAAGFVRPGGTCWFYKSVDAATTETAAAAGAAAACALEAAGRVDYELPSGHGPRVLLAYRKVAPLRAELPRRPGRAAKRPL